MADTPIEIVGNDVEFTVKLSKDAGTKTLAPDKDGKKTLNIVAGGKPLQLLVKTNLGTNKKISLGERWSLTIEEET